MGYDFLPSGQWAPDQWGESSLEVAQRVGIVLLATYGDGPVGEGAIRTGARMALLCGPK